MVKKEALDTLVKALFADLVVVSQMLRHSGVPAPRFLKDLPIELCSVLDFGELACGLSTEAPNQSQLPPGHLHAPI